MTTVKNLASIPAKTNGTEQKPAEQVQPINLKEEAKKDEVEKLPALEERLHRLNVLFELQKKWGKLQESKQKLKTFALAQNKENSSLELSDDEGNEFTTSNPVVIGEVLKLVLKTIETKSAELEAQIKF